MSSQAVLVRAMVSCCLIFAGSAYALTPQERLGKFLYEDTSLSNPAGQSCQTCHHPNSGFADPLNRRAPYNWPVSVGADGQSVGARNAPTAAYAAYSPPFFWDGAMYVGGQFWDGRAATLADQAKGPFLNPVEMNNTKEGVVSAVLAGPYARLFRQVCGRRCSVDEAYDCIADAIAAFESTQILLKFSSKYDAYLAGAVALSEQEILGLSLFNDPEKGKCFLCHPSAPAADGTPPLFTDFTYDNLGIPLNPRVEELRAAADLPCETDYGLGGVLDAPEEWGKFKVPTLRNVAKTPPYGHNGYFATLYEIVEFYNSRDVGDWEPPEVPQNVNMAELGDLGLTAEEVDAIVAFLLTLSDGLVIHAP